MNIERIIKMYFLVVMLMVSVAALSYNTGVKNMMASVFFIDASASDGILTSNFGNSRLPKITYNPQFMANNTLRAFEFPAKRESEISLTLEITNDEKTAYASPGAKGVHLMDLKVQALGEEMQFDNLTLKIEGVEASMIENVYIKTGEVSFEASRGTNYLKFSDMDLNLLPGEMKTLQVYADLSADLKSSDRFRFDIEQSDDLGIFVAEEKYLPVKNYPVKGKYLTIANKRPLFVKSEDVKK